MISEKQGKILKLVQKEERKEPKKKQREVPAFGTI
jgi:hypothetical protein